jgi:hypothetical protein
MCSHSDAYGVLRINMRAAGSNATIGVGASVSNSFREQHFHWVWEIITHLYKNSSVRQMVYVLRTCLSAGETPAPPRLYVSFYACFMHQLKTLAASKH